MSVKLMTVDQLHSDLATTYNMWPGGIPVEQVDRVNALRAELKRRGADARSNSFVTAQQPAQPTVSHLLSDMTDTMLQVELRNATDAISKDPGNDSLQERFADIRFEMRKRANKVAVAAQAPVTPPAPVIQWHTPIEIDGNSRGRLDDQPTLGGIMHKTQLSQLAAKIAGSLLAPINGDAIDGDAIEFACAVAVKAAETILAKVGL